MHARHDLEIFVVKHLFGYTTKPFPSAILIKVWEASYIIIISKATSGAKKILLGSGSVRQKYCAAWDLFEGEARSLLSDCVPELKKKRRSRANICRIPVERRKERRGGVKGFSLGSGDLCAQYCFNKLRDGRRWSASERKGERPNAKTVLSD